MQRIPFLIISDYEIVNPSTLSFSDFGFPVDILTPTQEMTGTVGGATRTCRNTFGGKAADKEMAFSCFDNGQYVCSILFQDP